MITPSINTLGFPDWTIYQVIDFAAAHRVPFIEIRALQNTVNLLSLPDFNTSAGLNRVSARLREKGVRLIGLNLGFHLQDDLSTHAETIRRYAEAAQAVDAPYLRFFSGGRPSERPDLQRLAQGAKLVQQLLEPFPVRMIVETHDSLVRSTDILALNEILGGKLNLLWDIAHTRNHGGEPWQATFDALRPLIRYLHVKDTRKAGEQIQNTLLFEGDLQVRELLSYLAGLPEEWIVSFEWEKMWDPTLAPGDQAAGDFLEKLKTI